MGRQDGSRPPFRFHFRSNYYSFPSFLLQTEAYNLLQYIGPQIAITLQRCPVRGILFIFTQAVVSLLFETARFALARSERGKAASRDHPVAARDGPAADRTCLTWDTAAHSFGFPPSFPGPAPTHVA
jgi:hypothetical protein